MDEYFTLTKQDIAIITNLNPIGLGQKAQRQNWLYFTEPHSHGSPINLYPFETLPDEVQVAWAQWDEVKYNAARISEKQKGDAGRAHKIPPPLSKEQAVQALALPTRKNWYKQHSPGQKPIKGGKAYDGQSKGLCQEAREVLLLRFPSLKNIQPGQTTNNKQNRQEQSKTVPEVMEEASELYHTNRRVHQSTTRLDQAPMTVQKMNQAAGSERPRQTTADLHEILKDCHEDKKYLRESFKEQREVFKQSLAEKDRIIEQLRRELAESNKQNLDKDLMITDIRKEVDQLNNQVNNLHQELHFKNEQLLQITTSQKRESRPQAPGNKTPYTGKRDNQ